LYSESETYESTDWVAFRILRGWVCLPLMEWGQ